MAETTADGLRADIVKAYDEYTAELKQHGAGWEKKPAGGEGEAAWCAREVAQHVAEACGFFGSSIAKVIGVDGPAMGRVQFADAPAAIAAMPAAHAGLASVIDKVQDSHLATETEFGPLGKTNLGAVIGIVSYHLRDHASQLKALR